MKKILILTGVDWDSTYQRHQRIANYISKEGYEVFYIGNIVSSKFTLKALIKFFYRELNKNYNKNFKEKNIKIINKRFLNPQLLFRNYNYFYVKRILKEIGNEFDLVINYLPIETTEYFIKNIKYKILIYDCVRNFKTWGGYPKNIEKIENNLIKKSDYIFVDSFYLKDKLKNQFPEKDIIQLLPTITNQELEVYKKYQKKPTLIKRIVYFGMIDDRNLDIELLNELSIEYEIILIGKIKGKIKISDRIKILQYISDLEKLAKTIMEIADAIILPYSNNMDGVIPAKTIQVIATGLPIYVKEFYDSIKLREYWYTYKDLKELKQKIKYYNEENMKMNEIKRKEFLNKNLEEKNFKVIKKIIEGIKK